jgi:hypothetical protein
MYSSYETALERLPGLLFIMIDCCTPLKGKSKAEAIASSQRLNRHCLEEIMQLFYHIKEDE